MKKNNNIILTLILVLLIGLCFFTYSTKHQNIYEVSNYPVISLRKRTSALDIITKWNTLNQESSSIETDEYSTNENVVQYVRVKDTPTNPAVVSNDANNNIKYNNDNTNTNSYSPSTSTTTKPSPSTSTTTKPSPSPSTSTTTKPSPSPSTSTTTKPSPSPSTSTTIKPSPSTTKPNNTSKTGLAGRLYLPTINHSVNIYYANINDNASYNAQKIVDNVDSAAYYQFGGKYVIADHNYQGFSKIGGLKVGETAYIKNVDGTKKYYRLIRKLIGINTTRDLTDKAGNSLQTMEGSLAMYTCYIGVGEIVLTLWDEVA